MGRWFAVGHDHDLTLTSFVAHEVTTEGQGVLEIGAVGVVDGESRDVFDLEFLGRLAKPTTATKSRGNFERMSDVRASTIFFAARDCSASPSKVRGRSRTRWRATRRLELLDLEVIGVQFHGRTRSLAQHGVTQGLGKVQRERFTGCQGLEVSSRSPRATRSRRGACRASANREAGRRGHEGPVDRSVEPLRCEMELATLAIDEP